MDTQVLQQDKPLAGTLKAIFSGLSEEPKQKNARLAQGWEKIVGRKIAVLATPKFSREGVVVWVGSSTLACELGQKYGGVILKRLQNEFGQEEVKKVWFCVGTPH